MKRNPKKWLKRAILAAVIPIILTASTGCIAGRLAGRILTFPARVLMAEHEDMEDSEDESGRPVYALREYRERK